MSEDRNPENSEGSTEPELEDLSLRILPTNEEELTTLFVNNFVSQFTEGEFFLTFYQIAPPNTAHLTSEQILEKGFVPARAVFRVALTPRRMAELKSVIDRNFGRYVEQFGNPEIEEGES